MFLTKQERQAIKATYDFWCANKKAPQQFRNKLADDFLIEWQSIINVMKPIMMHPDTRRKDFERSRSLADIIADFILDISQVDEREQDYPIENAEKAFREKVKRQKHERSIVFQSEFDRDNGRMGEDYRTPKYSIEEHAFNNGNPVENELFEELPDVKRFQAELRHVKKFAGFYSVTYAEEYGKDEAEVIQRIKKLDIGRVRQCKVCGNPFYAHDLRRYVCDQQRGIKVIEVKGKKTVYKVTNVSACELERNRENARKHAS